jgi:CheY-like chemotaxis protein
MGGERTAATADPGRLGVLVVDDSAPIRDLVRLVLEGEGYAVQEAADGAAALGRVRAAPPGVILLDLEMPGLDGPGFLTSYRAGPGPHAPVVVMTATPEPARWATALGAAGWVGKPFGVAQLCAVVARLAGPPGP